LKSISASSTKFVILIGSPRAYLHAIAEEIGVERLKQLRQQF